MAPVAIKPGTRIYVAGPITKGNQFVNVRNGMEVWAQLLRLGFAPFCPHLSALFEIAGLVELDLDQWLEYDFAWIDVCDALLRMPGESTGADREVEYARKRGIPVFYSLEEIISIV